MCKTVIVPLQNVELSCATFFEDAQSCKFYRCLFSRTNVVFLLFQNLFTFICRPDGQLVCPAALDEEEDYYGAEDRTCVVDDEADIQVKN